MDALLSDCRFTGSVSRFDICDIQESRFAHFVNNQLDGSHFGCNITRVDSGLFANNSLQGRRAFEAAIGPTVRSVRGLKADGCAAIRILGNHLADYESPDQGRERAFATTSATTPFSMEAFPPIAARLHLT